MLATNTVLPFVDPVCRRRLPDNLRKLFEQVYVNVDEMSRSRLEVRLSSIGHWWFSWMRGSGKIVVSSSCLAENYALLTLALKGNNRSLLQEPSIVSNEQRIVLSKWPASDAVMSSGDFSYLCIYIPRFLLDPFATGSPPCAQVLDTSRGAGAAISAAMVSIVREAVQGTGGQLENILPDFLNMTLHSMHRAPCGPGTMPDRSASRFVRLKTHIETHYADPNLTPEQIAGACAMSIRQLYREFEAHGVSLETFLRELRLMHAKGLLLAYPEHAISRIAYESGFKSLSVFTRQFKYRFGQPPRLYRTVCLRDTAPTDPLT